MTSLPIKAVTFDFWGTLVDASADYTPRRVALLAERLGSISLEEAMQAYAQAAETASHVSRMGFSLPTTSVLGITLDALGCALPPDDRAQILAYWEEVILDDPPAPLPGIAETLAHLDNLGIPLGLISDTGISPGRSLRRVLEHAGLRHHFRQLTFSDEIGATKRRQHPFRSTLAALGVRPEHALHVGDLAETDIAGAQAVGMRTALLLQHSGRRDGAAHADLVLERCTDLIDAIAPWL